MKFLINFIIALLFSAINSAFAVDYYKINNKGKTYPHFEEISQRQEYIDSDLGFLSPELRSYLYQVKSSPLYKTRNGDIGVLVADLRPNIDRYILNVDENLILIEADAATKTSKVDYDAFMKEISMLGSNAFGFKLGKTTYIEAISILKKQGASFKQNLFYEGNPDLPIILVSANKFFPVINGAPSKETKLRFFNDRLYQISFEWSPASQSEVDILSYLSFKIHEDIIKGLSYKYNRDCSTEHIPLNEIKAGRFSEWYFWLNSKTHITLATSLKNNLKGVYGSRLSYNATELLEKANQTIRKVDLEIKEENEKKLQMEVEDRKKGAYRQL